MSLKRVDDGAAFSKKKLFSESVACCRLRKVSPLTVSFLSRSEVDFCL